MVLRTLRGVLRTPPPNTRHVRTPLLGGVLVTQPSRSCAPAPSTYSSICSCARASSRAHPRARTASRARILARPAHSSMPAAQAKEYSGSIAV